MEEGWSVLLEENPGHQINPSNCLTKGVGWVLHLRHAHQMMGHYGFIPLLTL
jgi:hypothetical protein